MTPGEQERIADIMGKAFERELARSERFTLTEEIGHDVLTVWAGLLDVVSFVPPRRAGMHNVFVKRLGEATLVIELRDSESHATLARMMDRRALEPAGGRGVVVNAVTTKGEVERLATRWAQLLRRRLDEAPSLKHAADPPHASD